jgi:hypothetical protein
MEDDSPADAEAAPMEAIAAPLGEPTRVLMEQLERLVQCRLWGLSKSVRQDIMARNALTMTSEAIFYHLPEDEIMNAIQAIVRLQSRFASANMLDTLVVFSIPKTFVLTPSNYDDFHPFLLAYNERFRRLIAYLGYDNEENLPILKKDRPGLLFFYLRAIPYQFGWSTFANLDRKHFDSLPQFFEIFMQQPSEMYAFAIVWQKHMAVLAYSELCSKHCLVCRSSELDIREQSCSMSRNRLGSP